MSVCLSVTSRCSIKTDKRIITQPTPRDSQGTLFLPRDAMLTRYLLPSSVCLSVRPSQAGIGRIELVFGMEASFYIPHSTRMLQGNSGISKIRALPSGTLFQTLPRQVDRVVNKTRRRRRRRRSRLLTTLIRKSTSRRRLLQVGQL